MSLRKWVMSLTGGDTGLRAHANCVCVWTQGKKDALIVPAVVSPSVVSCSALRLNVLMLFQLMDWFTFYFYLLNESNICIKVELR